MKRSSGVRRAVTVRTLRRLAVGTLQLTLPGTARHAFFDEQWLTPCSELVATQLERECPHDHATAAHTIAGRQLSSWRRRIRGSSPS